MRKRLLIRYHILAILVLIQLLPVVTHAQTRTKNDSGRLIIPVQKDFPKGTLTETLDSNNLRDKSSPFDNLTIFKVDKLRIDIGDKTEFSDVYLNKNYVRHLCEGVTIPTISFDNAQAEHESDFRRFHEFLKTTFPLANEVLKKEVVNNYSLLYTWKGQNPKLMPVLLIAHMDVVPVDTSTLSQWQQPAFSGNIKDGFIWGRGSMDDKVSVIGIMEALEALIKSGYKPMRDIYIAFGHDEETAGSGAGAISELLQSRGLHFQYILDEGGGILEGLVPYVERPVAFIGVAEKGYVTLELTVKEHGGHSSMPVDEGVVGILGKAIYRLQDNPFPTRLTNPVKQMFRQLGKYMIGINGFVASHPTLFSSIIKKELSIRPITNSLVQTTLVPTMIEGGMKDNVIPTSARMLVNLRILPGETVQSVMIRVKKTIRDKRVVVRPYQEAWNPSKTTNLKSRSYKVLKHTIEAIFPKIAVAPYLNPGTSDSRHYTKLSDNILRFVPIVMKDGDAERLHGINERISEDNYKDCIRFYFRFIINSDLQL
jgi:carboxypeptidase PM20D1